MFYILFVQRCVCGIVSIRFATVDVMQKYGSLLERYATNSESLNMAIMTMMYHVAGDCCRGDVLLQLPILKTFSEIWGDLSCSAYVGRLTSHIIPTSSDGGHP